MKNFIKWENVKNITDEIKSSTKAKPYIIPSDGIIKVLITSSANNVAQHSIWTAESYLSSFPYIVTKAMTQNNYGQDITEAIVPKGLKVYQYSNSNTSSMAIYFFPFK